MIDQEAVERALEWLAASADEYAQARANSAWLEERRKVCRSAAFKVAKANGVTVAEAEAESYLGAEYADLLNQLKDAIYAEAKLRALREAACLRVDAWRTQQASLRASNV